MHNESTSNLLLLMGTHQKKKKKNSAVLSHGSNHSVGLGSSEPSCHGFTLFYRTFLFAGRRIGTHGPDPVREPPFGHHWLK